MIEPSSNFRSLVAAGSVKPYAVTGRKRLASSPDIPTADEAGLPGFFASLWYGLWVPKDTPKDIVAKLNATMVQVLADPKVQARFARSRHRDHAARAAIARGAGRVPEGRDRTLVADHQGGESEGGVSACRSLNVISKSLL